MEIVFLGTGTSQGVPIIGCTCEVCSSADPKDNRLRSSVYVVTDKLKLVIDTGPDFRMQMLREKITALDAVLFTHGHKDHTAGFDDVRGFNFIQERAMDVYADKLVEQVLKRDFYYCFEENKYPGVPDIKLHIFDENPFEILGEKIVPIFLQHYKLPVFGFRIQDFTYITDANFISEKEKEKVKGSKVLVLNALRKTEHISHFNLDEAVSLAKEIGAKQTFFIHMSHQIGRHEDVEAELPAGVNLSYDGLKIKI